MTIANRHRANRPRRVVRACSLVATVAMITTSVPDSAAAAPAVVEAPSSEAGNPSEGSVGPRVQQVQEALIEGGVFLPGGADGVFGASTTKAIGDYQQWNGLKRTGQLNVATLRRLGLAQSVTTTAPSSATSSSYGDLALGSTGPAVTELQRALLDTGLVIRGGADGVFGQSTRRALMAFQRVNAMTETGEMSDRAAQLLQRGEPTRSGATNQVAAPSPAANTNGWTSLQRFPVQGNCAYGDTWHAPRGGGRVHEGVDIIAATGNLLYAVADGIISTQYWDQPGLRSGNGLKLTAADGTYFVYLHMSGFAPGIARGTRVKAGDVIGFVGNTGSSATPHLHFEIHPGGGGAINPYPYVRAIDDCSNTSPRYQSSFA